MEPSNIFCSSDKELLNKSMNDGSNESIDVQIHPGE